MGVVQGSSGFNGLKIKEKERKKERTHTPTCLYCHGKGKFERYERITKASARVLALRSGDPGFKTCSDHWLNLFCHHDNVLLALKSPYGE